VVKGKAVANSLGLMTAGIIAREFSLNIHKPE
jgi:hypothetical protein